MKALAHVPPPEVIAHRVVWSIPVALAVLWWTGRTADLRAALTSPRMLGMGAMTAALISVNWGIYVWAIGSGHALDAALGYYINPLFSIFLGAVLLGERMGRLQMVAIALAVVAVGILTWEAGRLPVVALGLTLTWGFYAYLKKRLPIGPNQGFTLEVLILLVPAVGYMVWLAAQGTSHFRQGVAWDDALLREASHRLKRALRDGPCLARCGGDEFIVHVRAEDAEREARRLAALIVAAFHEPFAISARSVFVSPSIGMSLFPAHGAEARELMRCADLALHAAKRAGGNTAVVYDPRMAEDLASRLDIESRLRRALDQDEFRLCYQPIYDIVTGRIVAVEALLRWLPEDGPVMMPADFIPIAEETGLIQPIGDWVLRAACQQVRRWQTELPGCAELRLNVNVSPRQLRDLDPRGSVQRFLEESGLPAASLTLELTESTFLKDLEPTLRNLDQLRSMGVRLSIDDFGTGYSCLAYLRRLPIDELKIDRSFVHELVRSPEDAALISAILAMAQALGLEVIAEGIESWGQLEMLREKGCRRVQGYRLGRPMFADDAGEFLAARARPAARGFKATDLLPA